MGFARTRPVPGSILQSCEIILEKENIYLSNGTQDAGERDQRRSASPQQGYQERITVAVALPTPDQLRVVAEQCGLALTDEDVTSFRGLMQGSVDAYNAVAAMPDEVPIVRYPRSPGYRPAPEENPRNAWYRKSTVRGASSGKLKGKTIALKDNIMLAGVPMMNGSATLEGFNVRYR
jgi:amidase